MDKEKILAMSRDEFRHEDQVELEAIKLGSKIGGHCIVYLCFILFILEEYFYHNDGVGYLTVMTAFNCIINLAQAVKTHKKKHRINAVISCLATFIGIALCAARAFKALRG